MPKQKRIIRLVKYFRADAKEGKPDGIFIAKGAIYRQIKENERKFIHNEDKSLKESFLHEKISDEQYRLTDYKGGMIVFATSVNSVVDKIEKNKIKAFLKKTYYSVMNYISKDTKINKMIQRWNTEFKDTPEYTIGNVTIGKFFKGRYFDGNKIYNDTSTSIEIDDIPSELLLLFAIRLCEEFKQDTVLVKDFNTNKIFLVDSEKIPGETPEEQIENTAKELIKVKNINKKAN